MTPQVKALLFELNCVCCRRLIHRSYELLTFRWFLTGNQDVCQIHACVYVYIVIVPLDLSVCLFCP